MDALTTWLPAPPCPQLPQHLYTVFQNPAPDFATCAYNTLLNQQDFIDITASAVVVADVESPSDQTSRPNIVVTQYVEASLPAAAKSPGGSVVAASSSSSENNSSGSAIFDTGLPGLIIYSFEQHLDSSLNGNEDANPTGGITFLSPDPPRRTLPTVTFDGNPYTAGEASQDINATIARPLGCPNPQHR